MREFNIFFCAAAFVTLACGKVSLFQKNDCESGTYRSGNACIAEKKMGFDNCKDVDLSKVLEGEVITLCDGGVGVGQWKVPKDCAQDGELNCISNMKYKAVDVSKLNSRKIVFGTTFAGIEGNLHEVKHCKNYSNLVDYDASYPPSNMGVNFPLHEFPSGSVSIVGDILNFGVFRPGMITNSPFRVTSSGTLPAPLLPNVTYYAIYIADQNFRLAAVPNGPQIDITTQGTGTHYAHSAPNGFAEYFDTLDDYNNGNAISPKDSPWGSDNFYCGLENFKEVTESLKSFKPSKVVYPNANRAFTQIWQDQITGLYFTNILINKSDNNRSWSDAVKTCQALNSESKGEGWHLPTQKELIQLYINGISKLNLAGGDMSEYFWSSTISSLPSVHVVSLAQGITQSFTRTYTSLNSICVR